MLLVSDDPPRGGDALNGRNQRGVPCGESSAFPATRQDGSESLPLYETPIAAPIIVLGRLFVGLNPGDYDGRAVHAAEAFLAFGTFS